MWRKGLTCTVVAGVAAVILSAGVASADPEPPPPPPLPDVNAYTPISPVDYAQAGGALYVFAGPPGVTCVMNRQNGNYGCSGPLPGAPEGVNLVSGGPVGAPTFSATDRPLFDGAGQPKALPPNTRLSFREVSCGLDGAGAIACVNSRDQVGFLVGPTTTYIDDVMPLLARPDGANPYLPGLPGLPPG